MGIFQNILNAISPGALTTAQDLPEANMASMPQQQPIFDMSNPNLAPYLAQATAQQAPRATPQVPNDGSFGRTMLAVGSGLLSAPGNAGLAAAGNNVAQLQDAELKRKDDLLLKNAKVAQIQANIARAGMPKTTSLGNGMVLLTFPDGSTSTVTDDEFRQLKSGQIQSQNDLNNAKITKLKMDIEKGAMPKFVQKIGDDAALVQMPDGTFQTLSTPEMQAAGIRMNNGKLERAQAMQQYKYDNAPLSPAEQKLKDERDAAVSAAESSLGAVDGLLNFADRFKPGLGSQAAGTSLGQYITSLASGSSADAAQARRYQQQLQKVLATDWVKATEPLKGALSDREGARLAATQPLPTDDYETVIKPWLQDLQKWINAGLEKAREKASSDTRTPSTANPVSTSGTSTSGATPENNPGNLRPKGQSTGFQQFPTLEAGIEGTKANLRSYGQKGYNTLTKIITRWSPPNENDTPALIKKASALLGVPPDQELDMNNPSVIDALSMAIFAQEGNLKKVQAATGSKTVPKIETTAPAAPAPAATPQPIDNDPLGIRKKK